MKGRCIVLYPTRIQPSQLERHLGLGRELAPAGHARFDAGVVCTRSQLSSARAGGTDCSITVQMLPLHPPTAPAWLGRTAVCAGTLIFGIISSIMSRQCSYIDRSGN